MNAELVKRALEKVGNPNLLINLISQRVRRLNSGAGGFSRPLVTNTEHLGVADIALREIIEGKLGWEVPEMQEVQRPMKRKVRGIHPVLRTPRPGSNQGSSAAAA